MKNRRNLNKLSRVKVAGFVCLAAAIASTLLTDAVSFETNTIAAVAFGLCLGILAWVVYYRAKPDSLRNSDYPFLFTTEMLKAVVLVTVVSSFVVSFAEEPILKLMGGAGVASVIGAFIAQILFNDE